MIIFLIGEQQVFQMPYNGCTGQDEIDLRIELVARHYSIPEKDVRIQFGDDEIKVTPRIVELQLRDDLKKRIKEVVKMKMNRKDAIEYLRDKGFEPATNCL